MISLVIADESHVWSDNVMQLDVTVTLVKCMSDNEQQLQYKRLYWAWQTVTTDCDVIAHIIKPSLGPDNGLHLPKLHCRPCTWPRADAASHPGWWATRTRGSWWQAHRRRRGWRWLCKEEVVRLWEEEGKAHNTQPAVNRMHLENLMNKKVWIVKKKKSSDTGQVTFCVLYTDKSGQCPRVQGTDHLFLA